MNRKLGRILFSLRKTDLNRKGLVVSCSDNYNRNALAVQRPPYAYMWYYRTEVRNTLEIPLRIVWFEAFFWVGWWWMPKNIMRRALTGKDFSAWYSDGSPIVDGVIPPGIAAVNGCNWHGSNALPISACKWAYRAEDPSGIEYYAEVVLKQSLIINVQV